MKRFFCLMIALVLISSLASCLNSETESSDIESSLSVTDEADFNAVENELLGGVTVNYYHGGDEVVVIPEYIDGKPVVEVDFYAFSYNQKTKEVYLPDTVKQISNGMLYTESATSALEIVHLPEGLEKIDRATFKEFKKLKSINLPSSIKEVSSEVFYGCTSLEYVDIPKACFETGYSLFAKSGIKEVVVPEGVEIINDSMFALAQVEKITLPKTLKTLDYYCLYGCPLTEITLPEGLEKIDSNALMDTKIKELVIPKSVKVMDYDAILNDKLTKVTFLGDEPEQAYDSAAFTAVPDRFFDVYVSVNANGFDFPRWKGHAVRYFDSDEAPFVDGDYEYIEIENGLRVTAYLGSETEIMIPSEINGNPVLEIGDYFIIANSHIRKVVLPETLEKIGAFAFSRCERLHTVELNSSLKSIGSAAFAFSDNLKSIELNEGLESIGSEAFRACDGIEAVVIPESVTSLGDSIFANCRGIKSAVVLSQMTELASGTFFDCASLESVVLPEHLEIIGDYAFEYDMKLTSIEIPENVKYIGHNAFTDCPLAEIILPEGLEFIGDFAFQCSPMTEITIPSTLKTLYPMAFNLCTNLEDIYFLGDAPEILFDNDTWDKPNRVDFTVWYNEGASGFDGEFWNNYTQLIIGQVIEDDEYLD